MAAFEVMRTLFTFFGPAGVPTPDELDAGFRVAHFVTRISGCSALHAGFTDVPQWGAVLELMAKDGQAIHFEPVLPRTNAPLIQFVAKAHVVIDGPERGIRLISLPRRGPGLSPRAFKQHYGGVHAGLVCRNDGFRRHANRYVQHHVESETVRVIGERLPYDGVSEFWFDNVAAAKAAWGTATYMEELRSDESNFVFNPPSHRMFLEPAQTLVA